MLAWTMVVFLAPAVLWGWGFLAHTARRYGHSRIAGSDEIADTAAALPREFASLITAATSVPGPPEAPDWTMSFDDSIESVARRAGLDTDGARRASEAVLEALAERISAGEVDDLVTLLPAQFRPALERGNLRSHGPARRMSHEFLQRIADLQGTTPDQAKEHARAVFATLRPAVGEKEFRDVTAQLPQEYAALFVRPSQL